MSFVVVWVHRWAQVILSLEYKQNHVWHLLIGNEVSLCYLAMSRLNKKQEVKLLLVYKCALLFPPSKNCWQLLGPKHGKEIQSFKLTFCKNVRSCSFRVLDFVLFCNYKELYSHSFTIFNDILYEVPFYYRCQPELSFIFFSFVFQEEIVSSQWSAWESTRAVFTRIYGELVWKDWLDSELSEIKRKVCCERIPWD
jgi:hypothetical protein